MKKIIAMLACFALIFSMSAVMSISAFAAEDIVEIHNEEELKNALTTDGSYKLVSNVTFNIGGKSFACKGKTVTLDLNGYVIDIVTDVATDGAYGLLVGDGTVLTLKDSNPTAVHKYNDITDAKAAEIGFLPFEGRRLLDWDDANGTIEIPGGAITGATAINNQGGIALFSTNGACVINIEGGNYIGNSTTGKVGGAAFSHTWKYTESVVNVKGGNFFGNVSCNETDPFRDNFAQFDIAINAGEDPTLIITGGTFSHMPDAWAIPEGTATKEVEKYGFKLIQVGADPAPAETQPAATQPAPSTTPAAPATFDAAIIAAVAAAASMAGIVVSKKRK